MKLSEAIRLGAMLKPQALGFILTVDGERTCAIGSAFDAIGIKIKPGQGRPYGTPIEWKGLLFKSRLTCPARLTYCVYCSEESDCLDCRIKQTLSMTIQHLNDDHRWSRERIADFVATLEIGMDSEISVTQEEHISK